MIILIIETLSWGTLEVNEDQLFHFSKGIPGFDEETDFVLITMKDTSFWYLQSVREKGLSFLLGDPFLFYPSYEFELPDADAEELEIQSSLLIRCIITLKDQIQLSTINLLGPIVLNPDANTGKQIVLHSASYHTKHPLLQEKLIVDGKDGG
ncbi:flagellar assembly protein FliW [Paenibacillus odorifer]|uniref:flagellar assembly protein FliW n=1 Tax=Paenibacillus odorifer TaxID=189426 RepID=UPI0020C97F51|nr:flagellar assembly protein FliW [Paenibacillus odorifer]